MKKFLLCAFLIGFSVNSLVAQLITENTLTVQQYVQEVLLGANVSVSNITFNGSASAAASTSVGGFDCPDCNLGIASGFAMSTGGVDALIGPNDNGSATSTGSGLALGSDSDLLSLVQANGGNSIHDWSIIEFDFVPLGDTLRFNYVWGSEEYDGFVGSQFNDVFGFFISGPGISGPFQNNAMNIALVPGTTNVGVAINTINNGNGNAGPCTACDYYNQLDSDADSWDNMDEDIHTNPYYIQFDGYTDVLTAMAVVQCGLTYHIKLAVCDANDGILDSGIFLERESFSSNLIVQVELDLDVSGPNGNSMFETCGSGGVTFSRPETGNPNIPLVAYIDITGSATMGVDYTVFPDSVYFAPGVMEVYIPIDAIEDNLVEGAENVHIQVSNIAECGESLLSSSFDFFVVDYADPLDVSGFDVQICSGETVTLEPTIDGGFGVYTFDWSTNETTPSIDVTPGLTTTYFLTVGDTCGLPSDDATFVVNVLITPQLVIDIDQSGPQVIECGDGANLTATTTGGSLPYTWTWTNSQGWNLWGWDNTLFYNSWNGEGYCYVEVEDMCGFTEMDSIYIDINTPPMVIDAPTTMQVNCNDNFTIPTTVTGGDGLYWYSWSWNGLPDWNNWNANYSGVATENGIASVNVGDNCGQSITAEIAVEVVIPSLEITLADSLFGNCNTNFNISPTFIGGSGNSTMWDFVWTENNSMIGTNNTLNYNTDNSTQIEVAVTDLCGTTAADSVMIIIQNPALFISLGDNVNASCIDETTFAPTIQGGSGGFTFQWTVDGTPVGIGGSYTLQSFETVTVALAMSDACGQSSSDAAELIIPNIPLSITAVSDTTICVGQDAYLWALAEGGEGGFGYVWSNEEVGDSITINGLDITQILEVVATDICGASITEQITVNVLPVSAGFTVQNHGDNLFTFTAMPTPPCPDCDISWSFGDGFTDDDITTTHQYDGLDSYQASLTLVNEIGCSNTQYYTVLGSALIYIPSSFTPNGDGVNDVWRVVNKGIMEYEISIFNRWGDVVFTSKNPEEVWIGGTLKEGEGYYNQTEIYNYALRVKGFDSETYKTRGTITMIR
jgi:gliding motility-associated-like protein